jgi:hypothetical protein
MERCHREFSIKAFHRWGRIWKENQTLIAQERITFPKVADYDGLGNRLAWVQDVGDVRSGIPKDAAFRYR